jgi:hypothetical protein
MMVQVIYNALTLRKKQIAIDYPPKQNENMPQVEEPLPNFTGGMKSIMNMFGILERQTKKAIL